MPTSTIVLLFIKAPVRGQVKSRLAASIGEEMALELYKRFILDIVATVNASNHPLRICYSPPEEGELFSSWSGQGIPVVPQKGNGLGARMENAFHEVFSEGATSAVLIGSDLPDLPASIIQDAFEALNRCDAVIGPAADGGYYLIGFTRAAFSPRVFQRIPWSTGRVFEETMEKFRGSRFRVHVLREWSDVDTIEDLRTLLLRNRERGPGSSRTLSFLTEQRDRLEP